MEIRNAKGEILIVLPGPKRPLPHDTFMDGELMGLYLADTIFEGVNLEGTNFDNCTLHRGRQPGRVRNLRASRPLRC